MVKEHLGHTINSIVGKYYFKSPTLDIKQLTDLKDYGVTFNLHLPKDVVLLSATIYL